MTDKRETRPVDEHLGMATTSGRSENLLDWLYQLGERQREKQGKGAWLIKGKDLPWEQNRNGKMKWFLHPALEETAIRSMMFWEQEIPAGSRTGAQKSPGGTVMYILEGTGYTLLDDVRHDWEAEDVVNIPIRTEGVVVQHVNLDPEKPVKFIAADLNLVDILGVDRGSEFRQVEDAPAS